MTRMIKILLMASIAAWGIFGGLSNLLDYSAGLDQVRYVLSMEGAAGAPFSSLKRIESPWLISLGFSVIYLSKFATGLLCAVSVIRLWRARKSTNGSFDLAKRLGIVGGGIGIAMLFLAFIVVAGVYFEYWRVPTYGMITHQYAFIYIACITSFLVFIDKADTSTA